MIPPPAESPRQLYLPDFCRARAVLGIVLICELTALVVSLARNEAVLGFWADLGRTSMFLLWIGLFGAGALCALRGYLNRQSVAKGSALVLSTTAVLVLVISSAAYFLGKKIGWFNNVSLVPDDHWTFLLRNVFIAIVVTALALRYFYVTHEWRHNVELQAKARVYALQARIRPHFLFNSMNTIAALTRSNPARAEEAVQDLADLFRANLNEKRNEIKLAEEIDVARTYQRMEQLRLGDRLRVDWKVDSLPATALVPGLTLQPLLENAIYHGIEPRADGGVVKVTGEFAKLAIPVLNQVISKFTAKWHPLSLAGAFQDAPRCTEFRAELAGLQEVLRNYTRALADLAQVEELTALEQA